MRKAGIRWVRSDFSWSSVERRPGQWAFGHLDETVDWAEAAGVKILPILDYDVAWARPAHKHLDQWLGRGYPLVLVVAPASYGKTTLNLPSDKMHCLLETVMPIARA